MRVGIIGGSIACCATAALLAAGRPRGDRLERSESDLVSRGAGIGYADGRVAGHGGARSDRCRLFPAFRDRLHVGSSPVESGTSQPRWLGDAQGQGRRDAGQLGPSVPVASAGVPDERYRSAAAVERIGAAGRHGVASRPGRLVGLRPSRVRRWVPLAGTQVIDPGAAPVYRGMVLWRGLLPEPTSAPMPSTAAICCGPYTREATGSCTAPHTPAPGQSTERGKRLLMWGYPSRFRRAPCPRCSSTIKAAAVRLGAVREGASGGQGGLESRLAGLLPPSLFELVRQSGNSRSNDPGHLLLVPRSYARDRLCLVGDAGAVFPPFTGSGVLRAVANAASLADALAGGPAVDDALRRWSEAQLQAAAEVAPFANSSNGARCSACQTSPPCRPRPPTTGSPRPIPGSPHPPRGVTGSMVGSREGGAGGARTHDRRIMRSTARHIRMHYLH